MIVKIIDVPNELEVFQQAIRTQTSYKNREKTVIYLLRRQIDRNVDGIKMCSESLKYSTLNLYLSKHVITIYLKAVCKKRSKCNC